MLPDWMWTPFSLKTRRFFLLSLVSLGFCRIFSRFLSRLSNTFVLFFLQEKLMNLGVLFTYCQNSGKKIQLRLWREMSFLPILLIVILIFFCYRKSLWILESYLHIVRTLAKNNNLGYEEKWAFINCMNCNSVFFYQ